LLARKNAGDLTTVISAADAKKKNIKSPADLNLKHKGKAFENVVGDEETAPTGKPSYVKQATMNADGNASNSKSNEDISDDPIA